MIQMVDDTTYRIWLQNKNNLYMKWIESNSNKEKNMTENTDKFIVELY